MLLAKGVFDAGSLQRCKPRDRQTNATPTAQELKTPIHGTAIWQTPPILAFLAFTLASDCCCGGDLPLRLDPEAAVSRWLLLNAYISHSRSTKETEAVV